MLSTLNVSFEFFPAKSEQAHQDLLNCIDQLASLKPCFMTMTYKYSGSIENKSIILAITMAKHTGIPIATHLTMIEIPRHELKAIADVIWQGGIRHIVAVRGDLTPQQLTRPFMNSEYFQFTSDFIKGLKAWYDFEISVAAYPEKHPKAPSMKADIDALREKCAVQGVMRAISQFF